MEGGRGMGPRLCVDECATLVSSRIVCTTYTYMYDYIIIVY